MWHQALRFGSLFLFFLVSVFFGFVLFVDFSTYRRQIVDTAFFPPEMNVFDTASAASEQSVLPDSEQIFRYVDPQMRSQSADTVLIRMTGDVAPVRVANIELQKKGMSYGFSALGDYFKHDDLTIVNLETPLIENCPETNEGMIFCGDPRFVGAMKDAGIDVVGIANNHSGNYGVRGLDDTRRHLSEGDLLVIGDYELLLTRVKGVMFGIIALNGVQSKQIDRVSLTRVIQKARAQVDVVLMSVHWGREYELMPMSAPGIAPDDPRELGHWLVDQGVDLVLGNHPHVVQGVEKYKNGFISYAHGNFLFDQEWSRETKEGVIGNYVFKEKKLVDVYFTPVIIENWVRPRFASEIESEKILVRMKNGSFF